jgi:hypothetical protein
MSLVITSHSFSRPGTASVAFALALDLYLATEDGQPRLLLEHDVRQGEHLRGSFFETCFEDLCGTLFEAFGEVAMSES